MTPDTGSQASTRRASSRIDAVDAARGAALLAMIVYHFAWDLEFFGYAPPGMTAEGGWRLFARSIASSFLFLVGFSLCLAHLRGVRWRPFAWRMAQVGGAAALITLATVFATPDAFIYFGILHHIALASLLGLLFLRVPVAVTLLVAVLVIALPFLWRSDLLTGRALAWIGLASVNPRSNDFVPLFPFFGAVLLGIAAGRLAVASRWTERAAGWRLPHWTRIAQFAGRHSLAVYLIHQPVLIAGLWVASQFVPPSPAVQLAGFAQACHAQCVQTQDEAFCRAYCGCVVERVEDAGRTADIFSDDADGATATWLQSVAGMCVAETDQTQMTEPQ